MTEESTFTYKVRTGSFEGPLDLLLSLIEDRKLFVNEISLAEVTNDYISYIKNLENIDRDSRISNISYFIMVAATLILIKSKSLLPTLDLTEDETEKIGDLERRLRLYKIFKEASIDVKNNFGVQIIFSAPDKKHTDPIFSPDEGITVSTLSESMDSLFLQIPKEKEPLPEIEVRKVVSMEEMINNLTDRIQNSLNTSFRQFSKASAGMNEKEVKVTVIVSFLAMLELVREGIIDVIQNNNFEDITMNKTEEKLEGINTETENG